MKLPAVAIAALFACGIVAGLYPPFATQSASHLFLLGGFAAVAGLILAGLLLMRLQRLMPSAVVSMLSWIWIGVLSAGIAGQPLPADHVVPLVDGGHINLHTPLKWYGRLRDEPARLPWGCGYEIELSGVAYQDALVPVRGGCD